MIIKKAIKLIEETLMEKLERRQYNYDEKKDVKFNYIHHEHIMTAFDSIFEVLDQASKNEDPDAVAVWHVPCKHCNRYNEIKREDVKYIFGLK